MDRVPDLTPAQLARRLRPLLAGALVALDFDGTLAPLVADPQASRPLPGTAALLARLAERGARVAVVTGRDAATAVRLSGLAGVPGLVVAGLYGAELWRAGELTGAAAPAPIATLRARLPATVAADPALWIEDKGLSLVVHARRAADPDGALAVVEPAVTQLAAALGLEVHHGRAVLEVRLPGYDKARALRRLLEQADEPASAVLYAGDDVGDLPAFDLVRRLRAGGLPAWGVCAASAEAPDVAAAADLAVDGPAGVQDLLRRLTATGT
ncbi:MAG: trehalose-phosphatase [Jatrophihabitans sp.]|nr:MAG: trehalose-phosphatase [Jatrophihabitans sp.]